MYAQECRYGPWQSASGNSEPCSFSYRRYGRPLHGMGAQTITAPAEIRLFVSLIALRNGCHRLDNLRSKTHRATAWQGANRILSVSLQFVSTIYLAHLLAPSDFGVYTFGLTIITILQMVQEMGLAMSLVQRVKITALDINTVFWTILATSTLLFTLVMLLADVIAAAFGHPSLGSFLRLLALSLLMSSLTTIQVGLMMRELAHDKIFWVVVLGACAYLIAGVVAAYHHWSYWSLAAAVLSRMTVQFICAMALNHYRPRAEFSWESLRALLKFGIGMSACALVWNSSLQVDRLIVARRLSMQALGFYGRAITLMELPVGIISMTLGMVLFPVYSQIQTDMARVHRVFGQVLKLTVLLAAPLLLGLAVTAPEAVPIMLGPQWGMAIRPLQVLCLAGFIRTFLEDGVIVLRGLGHVYTLLIAEMGQLLGVATVAWFLTPYGLVALSWGIVGSTAFFCVLVMSMVCRVTPFTFLDYVRTAGPPALINLVVFAIGYQFHALLVAQHLRPVLILVGSIVGIGSIYLATLHFTGVFPVQSWRKLLVRV